MRERALLIGGALTIESRPGQGTTVRLSVPSRTDQSRLG
jgi:signal transduction histidine kinase